MQAIIRHKSQPNQPHPAPNMLLLLEHDPPVYTMGRRDSWSDVLKRDNQTQVVQTTRGGAGKTMSGKTERLCAVTWHGPGQLVGYPILDLACFKKSILWYVTSLQEVLVRTLSQMGLQSGTTSDVGVWVGGDKKIAAIGISASRWVTMHGKDDSKPWSDTHLPGFSLNVCNDLSPFESIIPCGLKDKYVTSLTQELQRSVQVDEVIPPLIASFGRVFGADMREDVPARVSLIE